MISSSPRQGTTLYDHTPGTDMNSSVSIVIAEDHPLFRKGLSDAIREDGTLHLAGEADNGEKALTLIEEHLSGCGSCWTLTCPG